MRCLIWRIGEFANYATDPYYVYLHNCVVHMRKYQEKSFTFNSRTSWSCSSLIFLCAHIHSTAQVICNSILKLYDNLNLIIIIHIFVFFKWRGWFHELLSDELCIWNQATSNCIWPHEWKWKESDCNFTFIWSPCCDFKSQQGLHMLRLRVVYLPTYLFSMVYLLCN